jgi:hypothetical protein
MLTKPEGLARMPATKFVNGYTDTWRLDWRAATVTGADDGGLTVWIDGTQQANITGIDNDTRRVDRARLGPLSSVDAGTSGTAYFDAFESRRSSYIGPLAQVPSGHFASYTLPRSQQQSGSFSAAFVYACPERS